MSERDLIEKYRDLTETKELLTKQLEEVNNLRDNCIVEISDYMQAQGVDRTASYEGLGYISAVKPRVYANFEEEQRDHLFDFLKIMGRADLIKETVNTQSLSSLVKEYLEDGTEVPKCIHYILKPQIRLNKTRG